MKTKCLLLLIVFCSFCAPLLYAGGACSPAISNGSCANATTLSGIAQGSPACLTGETTCGGSTSTASCGTTHSDCAWYEFQATATSMYVQVDFGSSDGCIMSSSVFTSGASQSCTLTELDCESGGALDDFWSYSTLTVGHWYYIQVCYPADGGGCGSGGSDGSLIFDVCVGEPDPPCNTCAAPCGTAQGYATTPTVATVTSDCQTSPFAPELQPGSTNTFCYDFQATATSVDFNVIITSDCGAGNVTNFSWSLYNITCGGAIQTGDLTSLTFSGLTVGNGYVFCYTFDVPAGCTHSQHCPFFVGATPLPINLLNFTAEVEDNKTVLLDWVTTSEINNDFFTIERTSDGKIFEVIGIVDGAGNSTMVKNYSLHDRNPYKGTSYYRLKQTDYDGEYTYSKLRVVNIKSEFEDVAIFPNPVTGNGNLAFTSTKDNVIDVVVYDVAGKKVLSKKYSTVEGNNNLIIETEILNQGMYFVSLKNGEESTTIKFIKE